MELKQKIQQVQQRIAGACNRSGRDPSEVRLIVVTKTHPAKIAQAVIDAGIADIGENRVQEIELKAPQLQGQRVVHLIGHLQTNKIRKAVPLVDWIQSVDSVRLSEKLGETCRELNKKLSVLIEVNTSGEESKNGCLPITESISAIVESIISQPDLSLRGFMTIGPLTTDETQIRNSFAQLRNIGKKFATHCTGRCELSMGMSSDFEIAIEEGSTMVRIGSSILGSR